MKKILFFVSFVFAVVCFAAPPPDEVPVIESDQVQFSVQDVAFVPVFTFEAQEVAFVDIGNLEIATCSTEYFEQVNDVVLPEATIIDLRYLKLNELKKPPAKPENVVAPNFKLNMQNCNYSYPFGADYSS